MKKMKISTIMMTMMMTLGVVMAMAVIPNIVEHAKSHLVCAVTEKKQV